MSELEFERGVKLTGRRKVVEASQTGDQDVQKALRHWTVTGTRDYKNSALFK